MRHAAVVCYCKCLIMQQIRKNRQSRRVSNRDIFFAQLDPHIERVLLEILATYIYNYYFFSTVTI